MSTTVWGLAIREFTLWVKNASEKNFEGKDFLPSRALEDYLTGNKIRSLLTELFKSNPPISEQRVIPSCRTVFAILTDIGQGQFITDFLRSKTLWDPKLPFTVQPKAFPVCPGNHGEFYEKFARRQ
jgi:hypothetical protein